MDLVQEYYRNHQSTTHSIEYKAGQLKEKITATKEVQTRSGDLMIDRYLINNNEHLQMRLTHTYPVSGKSDKIVLWLNINGNSPARLAENTISFDFRGTGLDRMNYLTESSDNLKFDNADSTAAYFNPLSGVMANYVYNSLLTGRPYFLQMIEDAEIATIFARDHLGIKEITVDGTEDSQLIVEQVVRALNLKPANSTIKPGLSWSQIITGKREQWPIQYLMPGGAYIK